MANAEKFLDIMVPFWGDPELLFETVNSIQAQDEAGWHCTVIDDCYPDPAVAEFFETLDDERFTYVRNEVNKGITENYREAVRLASAPYMSIMGCDDIMLPNYVGLIKETARLAPEADVIEPGVAVIDGTGMPVNGLVDRVKNSLLAPKGDEVTVLAGEALATSLIRGFWLYWPSLVFKTSVLQRTDFRDDLPIIQDLALLMDIAFAGGQLAYNPTGAFLYRRHTESASQKTLLDGSRFADERVYYAQAHEMAKQAGWKTTTRAARLRVMSRLHAVVELPKVVRGGTRGGRKSTTSHIFRA